MNWKNCWSRLHLHLPSHSRTLTWDTPLMTPTPRYYTVPSHLSLTCRLFLPAILTLEGRGATLRWCCGWTGDNKTSSTRVWFLVFWLKFPRLTLADWYFAGMTQSLTHSAEQLCGILIFLTVRKSCKNKSSNDIKIPHSFLLSVTGSHESIIHSIEPSHMPGSFIRIFFFLIYWDWNSILEMSF